MMVEFAKLKRTKIVWLCLLMCAGIVLFSNMNLFAGDPIADFQADPHTQWASHLVGLGMALAFLAPLQLALVASRIVDAEHASGGWRLNAIAGTRPGTLLSRKFAVASLIVVVFTALEFAAALALPVALGAPAPSGAMVSTWLRFGLGALGTNIVLLAVMLLLAAVVDSQIVVLGVGIVGGFLGVAALLSPAWLAALNPFGYYAVLLPFGFTESGVARTQPGWWLWAAYLVLAAAVFIAGSRALDRKEI